MRNLPVVRRTYAYVVVGVGLLLLLLGALKIVPGLLGAGIGLALLGLLLFGLSFVPRPADTTETAPMPFHERLVGLFFEPSRVFRSLRAHPAWLAALVVITLLNFSYSAAFMRRLTPERVVGYQVDKLAESGWMPPEVAAQQRAEGIAGARDPVRVAGGAVTSFVGYFCLMAFMAGLGLLLVLLFGGRINFWQTFSALVHAALPVTIIQQLLNLVLLYVKDPDDIHPILGQGGLVTDNLGALFSPGEHPILFAAASNIGLLIFYRVWLTATGLRHAGERVSSGTGWAVAIAFWLVGLLLSVGSSALFGNMFA